MTKATPARDDFETHLKTLVDKFGRHRADYLRPDYSEAQVRVDFINPFFEALGWDVQDHAALGPKERQVVVEKGETSGNPDYNFRHEGRTVFFVEAKAPHVPLDSTNVVMQAKTYAWNSQDVFLAAITDFEGFRLYDATPKPDRRHPDVGLIFAYRCDEYLQPKALDDLWLLSLESIAGGSIDRLLKRSTVLARQKIPVDQAFLDDLTGWREQLAKAVYKNDPEIAVADLNGVVQVFLDRLIFLRLAEDRGILPPRGLEDIAREWEHSGKRRSIRDGLNDLFREVNLRLNGEIFKPHRAEKIDWDGCADLVAKIIAGLYPPSPYRFDVIGVELLGSIYERYLGKTIRVTATRAVVEDKPEVRKAGGVYYTPKYIVDYIVEQTVGKLVEGKTPRQTLKLRVLDPACGSGSFLLAAYQRLIDHHERWYADQARKKRARRTQPALLAEGEGGEYRLSLAQKAEIVRSCIFGVDIDAQAVEITMMSLYIKMLEGEKGAIAGRGVLPPLRDNIKCGNSLISHDIARQPDLRAAGELSPADLDRINPFDWESKSEGFGEILEEGGFDVVISNPPYIRIHSLVEHRPSEARYIQARYTSATFGKVDIYVAFLEKALSLARATGEVGFIVPNKFMQADYGVGLRRVVSEKRALVELVDFGTSQVFEGATTYTCLIFLAGSPQSRFLLRTNQSGRRPVEFLAHAAPELRATETLDGSPWNVASLAEAQVLRKIEAAEDRCSDIAEVMITGVKTGANSIFVFEVLDHRRQLAHLKCEDTAEEVELERTYLVPFLKAESLKRYAVTAHTRLLLYPYTLENGKTTLTLESEIRARAPLTWEHLARHRHQLEGRQKGKLKGPAWYGLSFASSIRMFYSMKIVTPTLAPMNSFSLESGGVFFPQGAGGGCGIVPKEGRSHHYLLGILNSRLLTFFLQRISSRFQGGWYAYEPRYLTRIPIRTIAPDNPSDRRRHDEIVALVERMLELHKQKQAATSDAARARIEREIHVTDEKIDALVYELYGLTDDEVRIVEGSG